jgi:hypothetical protein
MTPQPHEPDINALVRACDVHNTPCATNGVGTSGTVSAPARSPIRRSTIMVKAIRMNRVGGPEVMELVEVDLPPPGPGEVRMRHEAIGLNYIDVYHRTGLYPQPLPGALGVEGAGVVEEVGEGVTDLKVGDRVAYGGRPLGAYSEARNIPASQLLVLPKKSILKPPPP